MSSWIKRKLSQVTNSNGSANTSTSPTRSQNPNMIRYEVFKSHWSQVADIICLKEVDSTYIVTNETLLRQPKPVSQDDVDAVRNLLEQMVFLLVEEQKAGQQLGPILEFVITQVLMGKLYDWYDRSGDFKRQIAVNQIKVYEVLISQGEYSLLHHKQLVSPMLKLLASCAAMNSEEVDSHVVLLLNLLCVWISRDPTLLDVFFCSSSDQGSTNFIIFSLLIGFIHREGSIGQQARDALLLCVTMSYANERVASYIISTDFCPVLATGLSALYSSLPRQLDVRTEDWHFLRKQDWCQVPALVNFMNSFEFCNSVVEAAPGTVGEALLNYIYHGFLVSVFGPALHKPSANEVIVTTAYLNLFLQSVTAPELLQCFLRFLLCHRHENSLIMNTLIHRIGSSSKLAAVSLSLFQTLLDLDCEDLMLHLVFRYLIPCQHILASQHRVICDVDMYCASAHRFINLTPSCYKMQAKMGEDILPPVNEEPNETQSNESTTCQKPTNASPEDDALSKERSHSHSSAGSNNSNRSDQSNVINSLTTMAEFGPDHESQMSLHTSYMDYLESANAMIVACKDACKNWSEPYNGTNPPTDAVTELAGVKGMMSPAVHQVSISLLSITDDQGEDRKSHAQSDPSPVRIDHLRGTPASPALHALNATYQALNATAQALNSKSVPGFSSLEETNEGQDSSLGNSLVQTSSNTEVGIEMTSDEKLDEIMEIEITVDNEMDDSPQSPETVKVDDDNLNKESDGTEEVETDRPMSPLQSSVDEFFRRLMESVPKKAREGIEEKGSFDNKEDSEPDGKRVSITEEESEGFHEGAVSSVTDDDDDALSMTRSIDEDPDDVGDDAISINSSFYETDLEYTPAEYSTPSIAPPLRMHATPYTGPFLSTLFGKVDQMPGNSLYENLLLTGIISRLSCYPQPLLRSFLLNTHVVFHPSVRSLYQVLSGVRMRIETYAATVEDFPKLICRAEKYLLSRDPDSAEVADDTLVKDAPIPVPRVKTRNTALGEVFLRRKQKKKQMKRAPKLEALMEKAGKNFSLEGQSMFYAKPNSKPSTLFTKQISDTQTKNVVFSCIIMHEFLKELAAISQEHAVNFV